MDYMIRFAHAAFLYVLVPVLILIAWIRWRGFKTFRYRYPLTTILAKRKLITRHPHKKIIGCMRFATLLLLIVLMAKPQLVDKRSNIKVEGIDIILVLDVSGSMDLRHHSDDDRSRFEVAKQEAIRFVDKRTNDAIGIVIFGNDALSRCPLTVDKTILKSCIQDLQIGVVDPSGTLLATSILTAANRLKLSKASSKVMILLTDGAPSENDTDAQQAISVAKKLGIKIYTIGIGDNQEVMVRHPMFGYAVPIKTVLNKELLSKIAHDTGGRFYEAKNAQDMRAIYDTIDALEKTEIEAPMFSNYSDWFMPLLWVVFVMVLAEIVLTSLVWFSL